MATKPKSEVVVAAQTAVGFSTETPDYIKPGTGRGSEEVGAKDLVLPRLEIVQALSPIKDTDPDIREGMMFNSATSENLGDTVYVIPVYYRMEYLIWKDQDEGGGFFGSFATMAEAEQKRAQVISEGEEPDFIEIVDTPVHFCLMVDPAKPDMAQQIVVSMAKTKAKVSRKWNALIQIAGGDRFSRVYKITTFTDENKKGQKFKNFVVSPAGFPPKHLYEIAEQTYAMFKTQNVRADHESMVDVESGHGTMARGEI
jgi:hypothetical protein